MRGLCRIETNHFSVHVVGMRPAMRLLEKDIPMLRLTTLLAASVAAVAIAIPASASQYSDPSGRFEMTVPDGWQIERPASAEVLTFVMGKEKAADGSAGAVCVGIFMDIASTKSNSQAEINTAVEGQFTKEFWTNALKSTGDKSFAVNSTGNRDKSGRRIHHVVFSAEGNEAGKSVMAKGKMEVQFVPGSMHSVMCMTEEVTYAAYTPNFDTVFNSYEPGKNAVVASINGRPSSMLTMFSGTEFEGTARVLAQDTPDLGAAGWVVSAGSLAVDGSGVWQVCDGVNYSGTCSTVSAVQSGQNGKTLTVNSARRLNGKLSLQSAATTAMRRGVVEYINRSK